jgi:hypothetical protein
MTEFRPDFTEQERLMLALRVPRFDYSVRGFVASVIGVAIVALVITHYAATDSGLEVYLLSYLGGLIAYFWYGHYFKNHKNQFPPNAMFEGLSEEETEQLRNEYSDRWGRQRVWTSEEIFTAFFATLVGAAPALLVLEGVVHYL